MQDGKQEANLWRITAGQRLRYVSATAATGVSSGFMLLAPLGRHVRHRRDRRARFRRGFAVAGRRCSAVRPGRAVHRLPRGVGARRVPARRRQRVLHVPAWALVGDRHRSHRPATPRRPVPSIAPSSRQVLRRGRHRRSGAAVQFRCGDRARLPRHQRRRDRSQHPPDRRTRPDPFLARCAPRRAEPLPDAVPHDRRVPLLRHR